VALVALEIPKVGLVMENARVVRWLKSVGDFVKQGEPLLELETEKSVVEIESTQSGRLTEILLQVDQEVSVGDQAGWLENGITATPAEKSDNPVKSVPPPAGRIKSSPVARRLAVENSIDLSQVSGTGPRGRVRLADVRQVIEARTRRVTEAVGALSNMRRAIARSMSLSNATVPQFIVERSVDWTTVQGIIAGFVGGLSAGSAKPSVNDFILQAIARSLLRFPALNATFSGDPGSPEAHIKTTHGVHVGLVVAVEGGLLVPVLHEVEQLGLIELAQQRADTVRRALDGRLRQVELEGATFGLSNLGARGPDRFTAIINPPHSAILAVGRSRECVVANQGGIHVRPMSQLTLTVDHRVSDGRLASDFLAFLVETLEGNDWRLN
jgi:pyruvate dehydrogenase E2 component (dihydrolipoamide acetyltransferase)